MSHEKDLSSVVSGSFGKFKPEIDLAIEELTDIGVMVLAPDKGWLYVPPQNHSKIIDINSFRRLPSEIGRSIKKIEDDYLASMRKSDFVYVVNPEGFIGPTVAFETGYALACEIPVYSQRQILDADLMIRGMISNIKILSPRDAAIDAANIKHQKEQVSKSA